MEHIYKVGLINCGCKILQTVFLPRPAQEIVKHKIVPVGPRAVFIRSPAVCVEGNPGDITYLRFGISDFRLNSGLRPTRGCDLSI